MAVFGRGDSCPEAVQARYVNGVVDFSRNPLLVRRLAR